MNPLKQGLKLTHVVDLMKYAKQVKEVNPLKQGLKRTTSFLRINLYGGWLQK